MQPWIARAQVRHGRISPPTCNGSCCQPKMQLLLPPPHSAEALTVRRTSTLQASQSGEPTSVTFSSEGCTPYVWMRV